MDCLLELQMDVKAKQGHSSSEAHPPLVEVATLLGVCLVPLKTVGDADKVKLMAVAAQVVVDTLEEEAVDLYGPIAEVEVVVGHLG